MARWIHRSLRVLAMSGALALGAVLLASCGSGGDDGGGRGNAAPVETGPTATATPAPVQEVKVTDNKFEPGELKVKVGTVVRWTFSGTNEHSVLLSGTDSGKKSTGTFEKVFREAGARFPYQCGVHGASMAGVIIVE